MIITWQQTKPLCNSFWPGFCYFSIALHFVSSLLLFNLTLECGTSVHSLFPGVHLKDLIYFTWTAIISTIINLTLIFIVILYLMSIPLHSNSIVSNYFDIFLMSIPFCKILLSFELFIIFSNDPVNHNEEHIVVIVSLLDFFPLRMLLFYFFIFFFVIISVLFRPLFLFLVWFGFENSVCNKLCACERTHIYSGLEIL